MFIMDKNLFHNLNSARGGGIAFSLMMVVFVLINFIGQAIVGAIFGAESVYYTAICSCFSTLAICTVIIIFKLGGGKLKEITGLNGFKWYYAVIAILLSAAMFFGLGFVNDVIVGLFGSWGAQIQGISVPLNTVGQYILFTVVLALLPAVFEEVFFRGLIIKCMDGVKPAYVVIAVSICFSFYHCSVAQLIYQLIYGALLTLLALASKSSIPSIIAHFINNFAVITLEYFKVYVNLYSVIGIIVGIIVVLAIVIVLIRLLKIKGEKNGANANQRVIWFYPFAALGLFVCVTMMIGALVLAFTGGAV